LSFKSGETGNSQAGERSSMRFAQAFAVIGQHVDDAALSDPAA
jgi:hypothetical protein